MNKLLFNLKIWYKLKFHKPIYRVDVLRFIRYSVLKGPKPSGLCVAIAFSLEVLFNIRYDVHHSVDEYIHKFFPHYNRNDAVKDFHAYPTGSWWWDGFDWNDGRMNYLNYLIDYYKDDKTDLRELIN